MSARSVIHKFGGVRPLAGKLGHRNHTTVQGWWVRDVIPAQRQLEILELAEKESVALHPTELIPGALERLDGTA